VSAEPVTVAYVLSLYPTMSGTFIQREIAAVEAAGVTVVPISINEPTEQDLLSRVHRAERERTTYVKAMGPWRLGRLLARAVATSPAGFARVAWRAVRTGHADGREVVWRGFYLLEALAVWDLCRRRGIRHLHAHFGHGAAFVAWFAAELANVLEPRRAPTTWSFTVHGWLEFLNEHAEAMRDKVEAADRTVAITDHCRSQLMRLSDPSVWDRIRIVHCGVDLDRFPYRPHPVERAVPRVLMVARLAPEKGHLVLFDAVRALIDRGRPVEVLLAGAGPFRAALEARIAALGLGDHVRLLGPVGQDDIVGLLDDVDVFVLPSFSEGLPVALMEALAVGLPAVATAITGVPELIEDRVTGRLVTAARADLLADAIADLVDDPVLRARVQQEGRRRVEAGFVSGPIGVELATLFGEVIAEATVGRRRPSR
jgi:colanic acid/amylovoran biosynthesis glycosyltransferase